MSSSSVARSGVVPASFRCPGCHDLPGFLLREDDPSRERMGGTQAVRADPRWYPSFLIVPRRGSQSSIYAGARARPPSTFVIGASAQCLDSSPGPHRPRRMTSPVRIGAHCPSASSRDAPSRSPRRNRRELLADDVTRSRQRIPSLLNLALVASVRRVRSIRLRPAPRRAATAAATRRSSSSACASVSRTAPALSRPTS